MTHSDSGGGHGSQGDPASAASSALSSEKEARGNTPVCAHETPAAVIHGGAKRRLRRFVRILTLLQLPRKRANLVALLCRIEWVGRETIDDDLKILVDGGYIVVMGDVMEATRQGREYLDEIRKKLREAE